MRKAEIALAAIMVVVAASMIGNSFSFGLRDRFGPGPGFTPLLLGTALLLCALPILVAALRRPEDGKTFLPVGADRRRVLLVYSGSIATALLMPVLGVRLIIPLFIAFLMRTLEKHSWVRVGGVALGAAAFVYVIFELWLKVPLPAGLLGL